MTATPVGSVPALNRSIFPDVIMPVTPSLCPVPLYKELGDTTSG